MPYRIIPRRIRDRIGRRGLVLVLFGIAWVIQGAAVFIIGNDPRGPWNPFWHQSLPDTLVGSVWVGTGLASIAGGLTPKHYNDTIGFLAVSGMPMVLAGSYGTGLITRVLLGDPTWVLALLGFSLWGVVALALSIVAAWPEEMRGE